MEKANLIFISGGVRSGKSSFAEKTGVEIASMCSGRLHYIATGVASDSEMKLRIEKHKQDRQNGDTLWTTWEQSRDIGVLAKHYRGEEILLLDCLTTLLNNELFTLNETDKNDNLIDSILHGVEELRKSSHSLIIVSNEILNEPLHSSKLVYTYKKTLGALHQQIVSKADQAYLVEAGIPVLMKGGME